MTFFAVAIAQQKRQPFGSIPEDSPSQTLALEVFLAGFAETLPSAYAETPTGLYLIPPKYGVSKSELEFLLRFRRPILTIEDKINPQNSEEIKKKLQKQFLKDFGNDRNYIQEWASLSDRQAMIAYAVLRTNGSMPTYQVRDYVPNDFKNLLLGSSGNCSDYTIRLMMLLESIGIKAMFISIVTEHLPGHVVVDAYDIEEDTSYLLDANFNTILIMPNSNGKSFLEQVFLAKETDKIIDDIEVIALPNYFASISTNKSSSLTLNIINGQRGERVERWKEWIEHDRDQLRSWWIDTPTHRPATLLELRRIEVNGIPKLDQIPPTFNYSGSYAENLRKYLGINE